MSLSQDLIRQSKVLQVWKLLAAGDATTIEDACTQVGGISERSYSRWKALAVRQMEELVTRQNEMIAQYLVDARPVAYAELIERVVGEDKASIPYWPQYWDRFQAELERFAPDIDTPDEDAREFLDETPDWLEGPRVDVNLPDGTRVTVHGKKTGGIEGDFTVVESEPSDDSIPLLAEPDDS